MIREATVSADTVDEAIEMACAELGVPVGEYPPEILQLPKKGLFGKIKKQAIVKITVDDGQPEPKTVPAPKQERPAEERKPQPPKQVARTAPASKSEPIPQKPAAPSQKEESVSVSAPVLAEEQPVNEEELEQKIAVAKTYIESIFAELELKDISIVFSEAENKTVQIHLDGGDIGTVIGKRGETLDAIQYLVCLAANRLGGDYIRFTINAGNYREKREETLRALAQRMAKKVLKTGRPAALEPMNPYERRIIHAVVTDIEGVYSKSSGEEPNRRIVIKPAGKTGGNYRGKSEDGRPPRRRRNDRPRSDRPRREESAPIRDAEQPAVSDSVPKAETPSFDETKLGEVKLYGKIEL